MAFKALPEPLLTLVGSYMSHREASCSKKLFRGYLDSDIKIFIKDPRPKRDSIFDRCTDRPARAMKRVTVTEQGGWTSVG